MAKRLTKKLRNPFVYEGYESPDYFCDRAEETEKLIANWKNGRNVTLVSPRKIGKTGLIKHAFYHIKEQERDAICIYTDIFHTQNQYELAQALGRAVVQERLLDARSSMDKVLSFFSMWRPTVSFDQLTGSPTVSVSIERSHAEHTIEGVFQYLKQCGKEVYFAIDEFQTILDYPEQGTEALLRSLIQFIHNVHFVFSGSKQHLMYEMFGSPKRPFYQSTAMMSLAPLHEEIYYDFALRWFKEKGGDLSSSVFHRLYEQFGGYTWYMQSVLNRLYEQNKQVADEGQLKEALHTILADKADQYEMLLSFLSDNQRRLLLAIAAEGVVAQPNANSFLQKYNLPSASSVNKALGTLLEKDMVYYTTEGYIVYDRFLNIWLTRIV